MAAQLYAETRVAEALYEALEELVHEGALDEPLAVATLNQLSESVLAALATQVSAKADLRATLSMYKYLDNVWQFVMTDAAFRIVPTATGSLKKAPEIRSERLRLVCVDSKLAQLAGGGGAGGAGGAGAAAAGGAGGSGGAAAAGGDTGNAAGTSAAAGAGGGGSGA